MVGFGQKSLKIASDQSGTLDQPGHSVSSKYQNPERASLYQLDQPEFADVPLRRIRFRNTKKRREYFAKRAVKLLSATNQQRTKSAGEVCWLDEAEWNVNRVGRRRVESIERSRSRLFFDDFEIRRSDYRDPCGQLDGPEHNLQVQTWTIELHAERKTKFVSGNRCHPARGLLTSESRRGLCGLDARQFLGSQHIDALRETRTEIFPKVRRWINSA